MIETTDLTHYSFDTLLRNGMPVHLRAIKPDDKQKLLEGYHRLSGKSMYFRFLGARHEITEKELKYLTEVDFLHHVALVATIQSKGLEKIIGVGRFVELQKSTIKRVAEVAFAVDDKLQNLGIGTMLFEQLVIIAQSMGVSNLEADVLASNRSMLNIFKRSGFELETTDEGSVEHIEFCIAGQKLNCCRSDLN